MDATQVAIGDVEAMEERRTRFGKLRQHGQWQRLRGPNCRESPWTVANREKSRIAIGTSERLFCAWSSAVIVP